MNVYPDEIAEVVIRHGAAIERLMNEEAVQAAFSALDKFYLTYWKAADRPEDRENLWHEMRALGRLREHFERAVQKGKDDKARLEHQARPARP